MKKYLFLLIVLISFIILSAYSYASAINEDLSNNVFRLHVIANSNSNEDQDLKYKVRDKLIEYMKSLTTNISSKEEVIKLLGEPQKKSRDNLYIYDAGTLTNYLFLGERESYDLFIWFDENDIVKSTEIHLPLGG